MSDPEKGQPWKMLAFIAAVALIGVLASRCAGAEVPGVFAAEEGGDVPGIFPAGPKVRVIFPRDVPPPECHAPATVAPRGIYNVELYSEPRPAPAFLHPHSTWKGGGLPSGAFGTEPVWQPPSFAPARGGGIFGGGRLFGGGGRLRGGGG